MGNKALLRNSIYTQQIPLLEYLKNNPTDDASKKLITASVIDIAEKVFNIAQNDFGIVHQQSSKYIYKSH